MGCWYRAAFADAVAAIIAALPERARRPTSTPARPSTSSSAPMSAAASASMRARSASISGATSLAIRPCGEEHAGRGRRDRERLALPDRAQDGTAIASVSPNAILGKLFDDRPDPIRPDQIPLSRRRRARHTPVHDFQHSKVKTLTDALTQKAVIGATSAGSPTREYAAMYQARDRREIRDRLGLQGAAGPVHRDGARRDRRRLRARLDRAQVAAAGMAEREEAQSPGAGQHRARAGTRALGVPTPWATSRTTWTGARSNDGRLPAGVRQGLSGAAGCPGRADQGLREAFNAVLRDKDLLVEAEKLRIEIVPQTGEGVQRVVESAYASPPNVIERLKKIVEP